MYVTLEHFIFAAIPVVHDLAEKLKDEFCGLDVTGKKLIRGYIATSTKKVIIISLSSLESIILTTK